MSSYEPPFCELFKAAYRADIFSTDFDDFCIGPAVHGVVADGAAELYSLAGLLRLEEGVDIHGHIRFRQVFSVQATARDCLRDCMMRMDDEGFDIRMHVHDEVIVNEPIGGRTLDDLIAVMREPPDWAPDLPLNAAGFAGSFYKKD